MADISYAFQIALFGFTFVIIVMFLLYVILILYKRFFERFSQKEKIVQPSNPQPEPRIAPPVFELSPQIVAAITAAVAGSLPRQDLSPARVTLTALPQPVGGGGRWADAGRKALMDGKREIEQLRRRG